LFRHGQLQDRRRKAFRADLRSWVNKSLKKFTLWPSKNSQANVCEPVKGNFRRHSNTGAVAKTGLAVILAESKHQN
jgi:hypothetical protein